MEWKIDNLTTLEKGNNEFLLFYFSLEKEENDKLYWRYYVWL